VSKNQKEILTPVGRLVFGSLYDSQTEDFQGNKLVTKNGANAGQPRLDYFFALAIKKGTEQHWSQTPWGAIIKEIATKSFTPEETGHPTFAWKVTDGDATFSKKPGAVPPCNREGYPGHWVLNFSSGFAPKIVADQGKKAFEEKNAIGLGDFVEVYGFVRDNRPSQTVGVYLNHSIVNFVGYGEKIIIGADPEEVGFSGALPPGASSTPVASGFVAPQQSQTVSMTLTSPQQQVSPYPEILNGPQTRVGMTLAPPPQQPGRLMTAKANGYTYDQFRAQGWNDEQLIQQGYMQ
jgi:hypothetical protein